MRSFAFITSEECFWFWIMKKAFFHNADEQNYSNCILKLILNEFEIGMISTGNLILFDLETARQTRNHELYPCTYIVFCLPMNATKGLEKKNDNIH